MQFCSVGIFLFILALSNPKFSIGLSIILLFGLCKIITTIKVAEKTDATANLIKCADSLWLVIIITYSFVTAMSIGAVIHLTIHNDYSAIWCVRVAAIAVFLVIMGYDNG